MYCFIPVISHADICRHTGGAFGAVGGIAFEPLVVDAAISLSLSDEGQEQWGAGMKFNIVVFCISFTYQNHSELELLTCHRCFTIKTKKTANRRILWNSNLSKTLHFHVWEWEICGSLCKRISRICPLTG